MHLKIPPAPLDTKIDALADRLADVSFIIKKRQSRDELVASRPVYDSTCSYFKSPSHGANRCDSNPHRDMKCPRGEKVGHSETSC